ncbi:FMN-binding negative transcriptional regulator [Chondromyces apiculatus]|uniref:Transcriptional regulator n=1 Tax=Chondromyces apiculatus DSM 436 TaxID=1192034 RepID=A0A017T050_9BACT|nr:FMN-binding negative transcriptional regulator [Chondromyces apiculatus]EYF02568.1 Hypothetical protein CAP_6775 [Chondromyces apiculatus DSM 436]
MYTPSLFREVDSARLFEVMEAHPFGTLVAQTQAGGLEISHLPFLVDRDVGARGRLRFHVARANPVWRAALDGGQVVAMFRGPHAYVSPRWYERPREQVPTWNYAVVHAHGRVEGPLDRAELRAMLEDMVANYEPALDELLAMSGVAPSGFGARGGDPRSGDPRGGESRGGESRGGEPRGSDVPWRLADLEPAFVESLIDGIVGLSLPIDHLEGKFKLSQNRAPMDRRRVLEGLTARGKPEDLEVARLMEASTQER